MDRMLLFGGTGDLAGRYLFPALAELEERDRLPERFDIIGSGQHELSDADFCRHVEARLNEFAADISREAREALLRRLRYRQIRLGRPEGEEAVREIVPNGPPLIAYLALPPTFFCTAVESLAAAGLPEGSRIVIEKPFGDSLESARRLNRLLAKLTGSVGEGAVFRVDHVMGLATVHNLLGVRLANRVLEPTWNSTHIHTVEIRWEETIALEGRANYFDRAGALKDVMQNHMLQILSLIAMELPVSLSERDLRERKVEALRAVRPPPDSAMTSWTRRARYLRGRLSDQGGASGEEVPDYVNEKGVDASRLTETWAEVELEVDNWRWAGTRFLLRAGKALKYRSKGVILHYRPVPHNVFGDATTIRHNELRIGLDGPETLSLHLTGSAPGPPLHLRPLVLAAELPAIEQRAYSTVLLDVLRGDCTLSIRGDEAEEQWRIMEPVLKAWADDRVPMEEYTAGSEGPRPRVTREEPWSADERTSRRRSTGERTSRRRSTGERTSHGRSAGERTSHGRSAGELARRQADRADEDAEE